MAWDEEELAAEITEAFSVGTDVDENLLRRSVVLSEKQYSYFRSQEYERLPEKWREKLLHAVRVDARRQTIEPKLKVAKKRKPRIPPAPTRYQQDYQKRKRGMRERLKEIREGITHKFTVIAKVNGEVQEIDGYIQTGCYEASSTEHPRLGEIFVKIGKVGDTYAWIDQWCISTSIALQYGAPAEQLFQKFIGSRFEPSGLTKNKNIPTCSSVLDYIARWILSRYGENRDS